MDRVPNLPRELAADFLCARDGAGGELSGEELLEDHGYLVRGDTLGCQPRLSEGQANGSPRLPTPITDLPLLGHGSCSGTIWIRPIM